MATASGTASKVRVCLLWVGLAALSWLLMQVLHESGHVLAAWMTGGTVDHVELHPLRISRTDFSGSRSPVLVIWAGPV